MKFKNLSRVFLLLAAIFLIAAGAASCSQEEKLDPQSSYGYVQFKLYKQGTAPTRSLESLSVANKIRVELRSEETKTVISQILQLHSYDSQNAEFGLRSDKMKLLPGDYTIQRFLLFNKMEENVGVENMKLDNRFTVQAGGLVVQNLETQAKKRGMVTFMLANHVETRAGSSTKPYMLRNVRSMDIEVENLRTSEVTELKKVKVKYGEGFKKAPEGMETSYPDGQIECSFVKCDTLIWVEAGNYRVNSFTAYSDRSGKSVLGKTDDCPTTFTVEDNKLTEDVELRVVRTSEDANINDYIALRKIWEALDGRNWSYYGDSYPQGANWNFDKELDMWGLQPGVSLDSKGRVIMISFSGFGASGVIPEDIGELTELKTLYIGTHSDLTGGPDFDFSDVPSVSAADYVSGCPLGQSFLKQIADQDARAGFTKELKDAMNDNLKPGQSPVLERKAMNLPDRVTPEYSNHVTGISKAVMRLTKLNSFSIANSPIESLDPVALPEDSRFKEEEHLWSWNNFEELTDIEIFNCPNLTSHPMGMLKELPKLISLVSAFNYGIDADTFLQNWNDFLDDGVSAGLIQALYLSFNNLEEIPVEERLRKMERIRLLDVSSNRITRIHPFGKEISFAKLFFQNNRITEVPKSPIDNHFVGFNDVEAITFANNRLTELPDIFNAKALFLMGTVDFSGNQISRLENGDSYKGINANIVNLSNNRFKVFPSRIFQAGSPIGYIVLSGNGMEKIEEGSLVCDEIYHLTTLDLSHNRLKELSRKDFNSTNLPYLQGLDISYNSFDRVPVGPLNSAYLMILNMRSQRDDKGNAILRNWPTGIGKHHGLRRLFLGYNDIRAVNEPVSPRIFIFDIKGNPNISIDLSHICPLIKNHRYTLFYDKTQDIRGCEELKNNNF